MQLIRRSFYIFQKDVKQEFKTRFAINAIILFAVVTLVAISFSVGVFSISFEIKSALLWIILFFSSMTALSHIFIREEETHTAETLKLISDPINVYIGKLMFNFLLLLILEIILIPLFYVLMDFHVENIRIFLTIVFLGSIGLSAGATMIAAIISKASTKGALFAILSFPIMLPVIIAGINGTKIAVSNNGFDSAMGEIQMLFAYSVVVITASILLFDFVWNE